MLTASIVTYKTDARELHRCLECMRRDGADRIFIVDNFATDPVTGLKALDLDPTASPDLEYICGQGNVGYGTAHNLAIRRAMDMGAEYHLVINSDVYFDSDTLPRIRDYMNAYPDVGQLQPRIVYPDGREQYSSRLLPTPLDMFGRMALPERLFRTRNSRYLLADRPEGKSLNIPYHQGSFMFFRMLALREVGLFDERFFMYPEDIDITRRVHEKFTTLYWPEVTVVHAHRAASKHNWKMRKIHIVNMIRYFNKWGWFADPLRRRFNRAALRQLTD